jgi:signal peptidase II
MSEGRRRAAGYLTAAAVLAVDQITKRIALGSLELSQPVAVAGNFLRMTLAWNRGAAFSMSWGGPWVLAAVTAVAVVLVSLFIWKQKGSGKLFTVAMGAVLGGAAGNLLDRLLYGGGVVDFIDVGFTSWRWPTFNVADIGITIGGILLIILSRKCPGRDCSGEKAVEE